MSRSPLDDTPRIESLPLDPIVTVPRDAALGEVARVMIETGASVVLLGSHATRAIDSGGLVRALARGASHDDAALEWSHEPVLVGSDETLAVALQEMVTCEVATVVVVDAARHFVGSLGAVRALHDCVRTPLWIGALRIALRLEGPA